MFPQDSIYSGQPGGSNAAYAASLYPQQYQQYLNAVRGGQNPASPDAASVLGGIQNYTSVGQNPAMSQQIGSQGGVYGIPQNSIGGAQPGGSNAAYAASLYPQQYQQYLNATGQGQGGGMPPSGAASGAMNGPSGPVAEAGAGGPYGSPQRGGSTMSMQPRSTGGVNRGASPMSLSPRDAQGAASGAASGAATGAVGGPIGAAAGGILGGVLGFFGSGQAAKDISTAANAAEQGTLTAAQNATGAVSDTLGRNSTALINAQNQAIGNVSQYGNYANNTLQGGLGQATGNTSPFIQGGQAGVEGLQNLAFNPYQVTTPAWQGANQGQGPPQFNQAAGSGPNGAAGQFTFQPTQQQLEQTPGYQFERQEGLDAIQNQNSASGLGASSNANLDAAKFATGLASANYQQAFNNAANTFGMNQNAFNTTYQNALQGFGANANAYSQAFNNSLAGTQANFGMAYQPTAALTQAGLTGTGQENSALLGFDVPAAQMQYNTGLYGGNAIENTAGLNAQQALSGTEFNSNLALPAAEQAGNFALEGAGANAAGVLGQYNNLASTGSGLINLGQGLLQPSYNPMGNVNMGNINAGINTYPNYGGY